MEEIWKDIQGYEGKYQVSNLGQVKSLGNSNSLNPRYKVGRILKLQKDPCGYFRVDFCDRTFKVHRLVAEAFVPNLENKSDVNHINGIKTDNRVENLEWMSRYDNLHHAFLNGLKAVGERVGSSKLTQIEVDEIREKHATGNYTYKKLGKEYGISAHQISIVVRRINWK